MELKPTHVIALLLSTAASTAFAATPDKAKCSEYVSPMLGATWYQVAPQNDFVPLRYLCGCMATAGGMEYRYWRWPYRMESSRTVSHGLSGYSNQTIRVNGSVPFDYDKILSDYGGVSTYQSTSKSNNYEAAHLVLWMDSLTRMDFAPGFSGGNQKLATDAEWYEKGAAMNKSNSDTETLWTAITNDLAFGSPIQVNRSDHAMVVDGYAVETNGDGTVAARYININWGWGSATGWMDFDMEYESNKLADFQIGFRPQKIVQFEPLAKVCGESIALAWHIAPCYTNRISGFSVETVKLVETTFTDDFTSSTGVATNSKFAVENGYLGGYPGQSGTYTYPESHYITTNSVLTFKETSRYMAGHAAYVEASFNGGDWQTLYTFSLTSGKNTSFSSYNDRSVDLSDYAGKTMRLRFRLVCNWQGWSAGGSADFRIDDVSISGVMSADSTTSASVAVDAAMPERYTYSASGLDSGSTYAFAVAPVMSDGSAVYTNIVVTTIGTPADAPEITSISAVGGGLELVQEGFFIECGIGITNEISVVCSDATTSLDAFPSHLTMLPDENVSVTKSGNVFTISLDATEMASMYAGNMLMLTLAAANADGTEAYKNLMLRFSATRQVLDGTFDVAENGDAQDAIWLCGANTIIDANGKSLTFKSGSFCGTGNVTLADSGSGGSFTFGSLDDFTGTLVLNGAVTTTLPNDLSGFAGTLEVAGDVTLSQSLPENVTLIVDSGKTLTLSGVTIAAALEGAGIIDVSTGTSTISNATAFAGAINLSGGTLIVPAGCESAISMTSGTLKIQLTDEEVAFGYSAALQTYLDGTVTFVSPDGTATAATISDSTISFAATAKVWTAKYDSDDYWVYDKANYFWDSSYWTDGILPEDGDYVILNTTIEAPTFFNPGKSLTLKGIKITGGGHIYLDESGSYTVYCDKLINDAQADISTSQLQMTTIDPAAQICLDPGATLYCEIDQSKTSYMKTYNKGSTLLNALLYSSIWQGTVYFTNYTMSGFNTASWGNTNSFVRFTNVSGWMTNTATNSVPIVLVDGEDGASALKISNGSANKNVYIAKLLGDGTLETAGTGGTQERIVVWDVDDFTGALKLATKTLVIGKDIPSTFPSTSPNNGRLHFCSGYGATITSGMTWTVGGGMYFDSDAQLTVNGTLDTSYLYANETGGAITLADGGTIELDSINLDGSPLTKNFAGGTLRITADATETNAVNFCAAAGKYTSLDAYGNTLTFASGAVTGSGDIYPTSTANALGAVVFEGLDNFSGTIYIDGSTSVTLPDDLTNSSCAVSLQNVAIERDSDNVGSFTVGSGGTLSIALTDDEVETGYTATGVTLDGGKIEFTDSSGSVLATSTTATSFAGTRKVWSPADGAASGYWMDEACWSTGEVAADGDDVYIKIAGDTTLYFDSTIERNFAAIIVQGTGTLTITNTEDAAAISTSVFSNETAVVLAGGLAVTGEWNAASGAGVTMCASAAMTIPSGMVWTMPAGLVIAANAFVNITGKWVGDVTVEDGGTLLISGDGTVDGTIYGTVAGYMEDSTSLVLTNYEGAVTIPSGVESIKIYYGETDISGAFVIPAAGTTATLSLNENGVVNGVKVKPELADDTEEDEPFAVSDETATFNVKTIPGLWYAVKSGTEIVNGTLGGTTDASTPVRAEGASQSLEITKPSEGLGFFMINVAPSEASMGE